MSWQTELPVIIRTLINDLDTTPTYTDDRLQQTIVVAAQYVNREINFDHEYAVDLTNLNITPDPTTENARDEEFIGFLCLRAACFLDQSTFRTKAVSEGIRTALGPANIAVAGNLKGFQTILEVGPCGMYDKLKMQHEIGNIKYVRAVLSPFVGNKFTPDSRYNSMDGSSDHRDRSLYS